MLILVHDSVTILDKNPWDRGGVGPVWIGKRPRNASVPRLLSMIVGLQNIRQNLWKVIRIFMYDFTVGYSLIDSTQINSVCKVGLMEFIVSEHRKMSVVRTGVNYLAKIYPLFIGTNETVLFLWVSVLSWCRLSVISLYLIRKCRHLQNRFILLSSSWPEQLYLFLRRDNKYLYLYQIYGSNVSTDRTFNALVPSNMSSSVSRLIFCPSSLNSITTVRRFII